MALETNQLINEAVSHNMRVGVLLDKWLPYPTPTPPQKKLWFKERRRVAAKILTMDSSTTNNCAKAATKIHDKLILKKRIYIPDIILEGKCFPKIDVHLQGTWMW